jgi:hypothetical protein
MKNEKPILFSAEMIRAILDGRKMQTRRVIKGLDNHVNFFYPLKDGRWESGEDYFDGDGEIFANIKCPYGKSGDELWVRENFQIYRRNVEAQTVLTKYKHPNKFLWHGLTVREWEKFNKWKKPFSPKSKLFMFRSLSRIQLKITNIRVERVQDISEEDILDEGIGLKDWDSGDVLIAKWIKTWNSINKDRGYGWEENPWVWIVEFERIN